MWLWPPCWLRKWHGDWRLSEYNLQIVYISDNNDNYNNDHQAFSLKNNNQITGSETTYWHLTFLKVCSEPLRGRKQDGGGPDPADHALRHVPRHRVRLLLPPQVQDHQRGVQQREEPDLGDHGGGLLEDSRAHLSRWWVVFLHPSHQPTLCGAWLLDSVTAPNLIFMLNFNL